MTILGVCWVVVLERRTRNDLSYAYDALVGEMSERQLAEGALRVSEVRFRSLVQSASDLTAITDITGITGYLSPAAEGILGVRSVATHLPQTHRVQTWGMTQPQPPECIRLSGRHGPEQRLLVRFFHTRIDLAEARSL